MGMWNRVTGKLAEMLAETDIDLIITEMMRYIQNSIIVIKAAMSTGLPVWIGYSTMMAENGIDVRRLRWESTDEYVR